MNEDKEILENELVSFAEGFKDPDGIIDMMNGAGNDIVAKTKDSYQGLSEDDILNNVKSKEKQDEFLKTTINNYKKQMKGENSTDFLTILNNYLTGQKKGVKSKYLRKKKNKKK